MILPNKNSKIGKRNLYSTENRLGRNEIWCAEDNHSYMRHINKKLFLYSNFNEAVIDKISIFQEIAPICKVYLELFRPTDSTS